VDTRFELAAGDGAAATKMTTAATAATTDLQRVMTLFTRNLNAGSCQSRPDSMKTTKTNKTRPRPPLG
jgi:hypothetical protein